MRYIIYARKSTEDDNHQVLSIESQLCELREFTAKEKLEIVPVQIPSELYGAGAERGEPASGRAVQITGAFLFAARRRRKKRPS